MGEVEGYDSGKMHGSEYVQGGEGEMPTYPPPPGSMKPPDMKPPDMKGGRRRRRTKRGKSGKSGKRNGNMRRVKTNRKTSRKQSRRRH